MSAQRPTSPEIDPAEEFTPRQLRAIEAMIAARLGANDADPLVRVVDELKTTHSARAINRLCRDGRIAGAHHAPGSRAWVARRSEIRRWLEAQREAGAIVAPGENADATWLRKCGLGIGGGR